MTQEERKERAEARKAAERARWQQELADRELMLDTLRDVLKDKTASPAQRLFAVAALDYAKGYHVVPSRLQYPDSRDDTDLTNLRARFAAELKKAENANT